MTAAAAYRLRLGFAITLAGIAGVSALVLAAAVSFPQMALAERIPILVVSEARAVEATLTEPADLSLAERWTGRTLATRPGDATAWARLAWIADERGDRAAMLEALERSYTVAPYGPDITGWRLRFAYGQWAALTPELRRLATEELTVTTRHRRQVADAAFTDLVDPAGRMAFDLTVRQARRPVG